jgi:hypothetical protein
MTINQEYKQENLLKIRQYLGTWTHPSGKKGWFKLAENEDGKFEYSFQLPGKIQPTIYKNACIDTLFGRIDILQSDGYILAYPVHNLSNIFDERGEVKKIGLMKWLSKKR